MFDFGDYFRVLNLVLVVIYFILMFPLRVWWETRPKEERMVLIAQPTILLVVAYASVEGIAMDLNIGARLFLYTPSLILCVVSLIWMSRKIKSVKKDLKKREEEKEHDRH